MDVVYSELHALQNGAYELIGGQLQPPVEKPERAETIRAAVEAAGFGPLLSPESFPDDTITRVHTPEFVAFLSTAWDRWVEAHGPYDALPLNWPVRTFRQKIPEAIDGLLSYYSLDAGTPITAGTWKAARTAVDVALTGARLIQGGKRHAFALCRPPGHHAAADLYGGYCFLNNAAIAAQYLRDNGAAKVAVLDVDYHHGNGTQAIFYDRADVFFASVHADPLQEYPFFLGYADETGTGAGEGCNANYPLRWGTGWETGYADALDDACRRIHGWGAEAVVVSLGVDTFEQDPISQFKLTTPDYTRMGERIARLGLPTLFVMEGGYDVAALGDNVVNTLTGYLNASVVA